MKEKKPSMAEQVYNFLWNKIQNCDYMPGDSLSEKEICEQTGCGRTPVREALLALQGEQAVEIFPRRGIRVAPFTCKGIEEIYQIRKLVEPATCSKYYLHMDKQRLLYFDQCFREAVHADDRSYFDLDFSFHNWLVASADNQQLNAFFSKIMRLQYRFSMYTSRVGTVIKTDYYTEHHEIIEALLAETPQRIVTALSDHINYSEAIALRTLYYVEHNVCP